MAIDPAKCHRHNVADTCAIWNVLSSRLLYGRAREAGFSFCTTFFVVYEALHKPRSNPSEQELEAMRQLGRERDSGQFMDYHLDIADLQSMAALESRMALGKGELSAMLFARKTQQAFLTDDQKARVLAQNLVPSDRIQTSPHILSNLYFEGYISDTEVGLISNDHIATGGTLAPWFQKAYEMAMQLKCTNFVNPPP